MWRVIKWILTKSVKERPSVDDLLQIPEISLRLREKRLNDSRKLLKDREDAIVKKK